MAHRGRTRPRYPRIVAVVGAAAVTAVAVLGSVGLFPVDQPAAAAVRHSASSNVLADLRSGGSSSSDASEVPVPAPSAGRAEQVAALPAESGKGRRIVFSITDQRVWLVSLHDRVRRTYLVSGSVTDNLRPGSYAVYSRSRHAIGVDDSGTMQFMVRFAHGDHAAIGFHDLPIKDGVPLQTRAELGSPQSHGCIRQARPDARALWAFAPIGTPVVVLA